MRKEKQTEAVQHHDARHLTSGRLLARNTVWNLVGSGAPMIVAVFSIPVLIHGLGKDRFGVLALAWAVIGYASLFDLGLGRALTQLVARKLGAGEQDGVASVVWTSLLLMLALGSLGAITVILASPWLVRHALKIPGPLQLETLRAFYLLGFSVPVVIVTAGLRGVLEAHQRFRMINALRIPLGIYSFAGPLLVLPFSRSLFPVVGVLLAGRVVGCFAHLLLCFRIAPELRERIVWHRESAGPLLRFGGWMTVSNIVGPLMVNLDRFVIGAITSMEDVAYYATPYEVVTKFLFIPGALVGVIFPAFSTSFAGDQTRAAVLYDRCIRYLALILFPVVLITVALAQDGLNMWLGGDFASRSFRVLQWLAVGVFMNSLAQVPFALVQSAGRPDLSAKLHLVELPCYLLALWWLVSSFGIQGAAIAWAARSVADTAALFVLARSFLPARNLFSWRASALVVMGGFSLLIAALLEGSVAKGIFLVSTLAIFAVISWLLILTPEERILAQTYV